jgi:hypothetical protein
MMKWKSTTRMNGATATFHATEASISPPSLDHMGLYDEDPMDLDNEPHNIATIICFRHRRVAVIAMVHSCGDGDGRSMLLLTASTHDGSFYYKNN